MLFMTSSCNNIIHAVTYLNTIFEACIRGDTPEWPRKWVVGEKVVFFIVAFLGGGGKLAELVVEVVFGEGSLSRWHV